MEPKSAGSASSKPSDVVPDRKDGSIYSTERAEAVIKPILAEVEGLINADQLPHIPGSLNRLNMWMLRMEKGNRIDDRTPIYSWLDRPSIKAGLWGQVRDNVDLLTANGAFEPFVKAWDEVEQDQASNWGPQSQFLPWTLDGPKKLHAVMSDKPPLRDLNWNAVRKAQEWISSLLPPASIHAITIKEALAGMHGDPKFALDPTTNAGYPSWVRIWYPKTEEQTDEARRMTFKLVVDQASALWDLAHNQPDYRKLVRDRWGTASQRTVQKGMEPLKPNDKGELKGKRLVIAMPKDESILSKTVSSPMQFDLTRVRNKSSGVRLIPAWAPMPVLDRNLQKFLQHAHDHKRIPLSGDISAFDASVPPFVIWLVAQAMSVWMDQPTAAIFLSLEFSDTYRTGVISPDRVVEPCPSSVKSGSNFTSINGCMINAFIQKYGEFAGYYEADQLCVMGDDFILDGDGVTPEAISHAFADFGMVCNASKQFVYPDAVHFLQRLHVLGMPGGMGSIFRVGGSTLAVEDDTQMKWDERNRYAFIFQALARLENANFNPEFETLVRFIAQGDKRYHLGEKMSIQEIVRGAGSYAERKLMEASLKPWKSTGSGVPFTHWAVNRVLRGEKLPPPGQERFKAIYGIPYTRVPI